MLKGPMTKRLSTATNAYDLLTDVIAYMLEEPKRIYMQDWLIRDMDAIKDVFNFDGPACGTVGCIAGNTVVLSKGKEIRGSVEHVALRTLAGYENDDLWQDLRRLFLNIDVDARYGTKKYAQIVAKRIRAFQRLWKPDLQAVAIEPPKRGKR
jgi:hypothetical protein